VILLTVCDSTQLVSPECPGCGTTIAADVDPSEEELIDIADAILAITGKSREEVHQLVQSQQQLEELLMAYPALRPLLDAQFERALRAQRRH